MINNSADNSGNYSKGSDTLNVRIEIEKYVLQWKWFLLGVIIALSIAFLFLRYSTPQYSANTSILIKDNKKSGISAELAAFEDLGIIGGGSANNTDNEIEILKSRKIVSNVVDTLGLNILYYVAGRIKETEVYKKTSPVSIKFFNKDLSLSTKDTVFGVNIKEDTSFDLYNQLNEFVSSHKFGDTISNELGTFKVYNNFSKGSEKNVIVKIFSKYKIIDSYRRRISISPVNKNSSVLIISLQDPVKNKAEDVLDELVMQYNLDAIKDKNQVSKKTKEFIDDRLEKVKSELFVIDEKVKKFKDDKGFTGLPFEAQIAFESLKEANQKINTTITQLTLANWIEDLLIKQSSQNDILPTGIGIDNNIISEAIGEYNNLILERNKAKINAGSENPYLKQIESQILSSKSNLLSSLSNTTRSLEIQLKDLKVQSNKVIARVKSIPENERGFIDISREQEIIGSLYQYLLKKKEEIDISLAVTVPNAKIIDVAYGSNGPVSPKRRIIYLIAMLLGLLIPFIIIYILDLLDTKVHTKKDIEEELSVPFLGDVPKSDSKEKIIIGNDIRSSTAEAFRLIRTNLDFMLASNRKESKAIFITSTTSGEGKSFISINVAATLALSGKKVLLMGMDLRAPKVTEYLGIPDRKGVTNYITDDDMTIDELIFTIPEVKGLDIISSGVIPPNPAELLMTKRIDNLFTIVKQEYDIVIVDTAPVNLVTDTLLIGKYADMFMYVVRANYLDKRLLQVPQELYNEKKLPNMAIVLNDTDPKRSYGYGYGGYGYGYVVVEKPWYKKIFSKD
jgi:capsular exopolysaccharide synthesis family protein